MDEDKHKRMQPKEVYLSRTEYYNTYPLLVFRKHIDQEERRHKFIVYLKNKQARRRRNLRLLVPSDDR
jgi:hypothetical protein